MREQTSTWLAPMMEAAELAKIDVNALLRMSTMSAVEAEYDAPDTISSALPPHAPVSAIDWIRFGELLRHKLGWDDTYPALPDDVSDVGL